MHSRAVLAAACVALSACADGSRLVAPGAPLEPPVSPPTTAVAALRCTATPAAGTVHCRDDAGGAASGARLRIVGGQRVNVLVASSNVAYDSAAQVFAADLTVQNLLVQRMGSDGVAVSGVRVFFHSGPVVTEGTGSVEVENPDGYGVFTSAAQPYFEYAGSLGRGEVSAAKRWRWSVPPSVVRFDFLLLISAPLVPTVVFDMSAGGNRDIYRIGIDGQDLTRLTADAADDRDPTVAGGRVVFTSYRHGNAELYEVPLAGGAETRLTTTADNETAPALSPDGTRLAFIRSSASVLGKLWIAAADATGATQPTAGLGFGGDLETSPAWLSASRLAFVSTSLGSADLFDLPVGGTPVRMPGQSDQHADIDPEWRPDAKVIFASNRTAGGDTELYLLDPATGAVTRITTRAGSDSSPSWLADGRIVFLCHQGTRGARLCWIDPASPTTVTEIATPAAAERPAGVRF